MKFYIKNIVTDEIIETFELDQICYKSLAHLQDLIYRRLYHYETCGIDAQLVSPNAVESLGDLLNKNQIQLDLCSESINQELNDHEGHDF